MVDPAALPAISLAGCEKVQFEPVVIPNTILKFCN